MLVGSFLPTGPHVAGRVGFVRGLGEQRDVDHSPATWAKHPKALLDGFAIIGYILKDMITVDGVHGFVGIGHVLYVQSNHDIFAHKIGCYVALSNRAEKEFAESRFWRNVQKLHVLLQKLMFPLLKKQPA